MFLTYIKGKIIEGSPPVHFRDNLTRLKFNSINRCCQQKQRLKFILSVDKKQFNQGQNLEEDSIVTSLALAKKL